MAVRIQGRYGHATANEMYRMLGVNKLPVEGMPEREVQGVRVYVIPSTFKDTGTRRRGLKHRVFAICSCGKHVPVGRLHQHKCKEVSHA